ncbi:MAG: hydrogenase maturation nickel metallochaperone HypA [Thermodesulfovibrionia bacterium]
MHEISIAICIADEIMRIARENNARRILTASLRIGKGAGVVIDSLRFALDVVQREYPMLSPTRIEIDEIPLIYKCDNCYEEFETADIYFPRCPICNSYESKLISGEEMEIKDIEIEV